MDINVYIEILEGSNEKFEYDEQSKELKLNFVFKDLTFPFYYGFIPNTLGGDGDQLDAIVLSSSTLKQSSLVECKVIGVFKTIDRGEVDDKIISVPTNDEQFKNYQDVDDLPTRTLEKWTQFYLEVASQKKKTIEILGLENKEVAIQEIKNSLR